MIMVWMQKREEDDQNNQGRFVKALVQLGFNVFNDTMRHSKMKYTLIEVSILKEALTTKSKCCVRFNNTTMIS